MTTTTNANTNQNRNQHQPKPRKTTRKTRPRALLLNCREWGSCMAIGGHRCDLLGSADGPLRGEGLRHLKLWVMMIFVGRFASCVTVWLLLPRDCPPWPRPLRPWTVTTVTVWLGCYARRCLVRSLLSDWRSCSMFAGQSR